MDVARELVKTTQVLEMDQIVPELVNLTAYGDPENFSFALRDSLRKFLHFKNFAVVFCNEQQIFHQVSDFPSELQKEYQTRFFPDHDPMWQSYLKQRAIPGRLGDPRLVHWSELRRQDRRLRYFRRIEQFYQKNDDQHVLAMVVNSPEGRLLGFIALSRGGSDPDFSEGDRDLMLAYYPLVQKMWVLFEQTGTAISTKNLFQDLNLAVIFFNPQQEEFQVRNEAGARLLKNKTVADFLVSRLKPILLNVSCKEEVLSSLYLEYYIDHGAGKVVQLKVSTLFQEGSPLFVILMNELKPGDLFDVHLANYAHSVGLSKQEAEVLRLLPRCQSNRHLAETLGVSISGARYHLKSIFRKTNCKDKNTLLGRILFDMKKLSM